MPDVVKPEDLETAVPAETASFAAHAEKLAGKEVAVLLYSYYASDPRPRRESEAMAARGMSVEVFCLREQGEIASEVINGVKVVRFPLERRREGKVAYVLQYSVFLILCFGMLTSRSITTRYSLVHVHNMPDFLVFAALIPKLLGARIILDLHDPMPELMMSIYGLREKHIAVRLLRWLERASIKFAHAVLTPNRAFESLFISRGCPINKISIIMNSPHEAIFNELSETNKSANQPRWEKGSFRIMYHGAIVERHGLDIALQAIASVRPVVPDIHFDIFGDRTPFMERIEVRVRELRLEKAVTYHGRKSLADIAKAIEDITLGLIPNRCNSFTELNMPTRIFEYLALGKPVIAPDTRGIRDYFSDANMIFFRAGDPDDLANCILWAFEHPREVAGKAELGRKVYNENRWSSEEQKFARLLTSVVCPLC